ncbi:MAG TPA: hypothetical protein VOA19_00015, partial [Actinomycetes bacterium]|nr:hypothetical protein [Actinomycetes bacterium]
GKTALVGEFVRLAVDAEVPVVRLDGRDLDPSPPGVPGRPGTGPGRAARRLAAGDPGRTAPRCPDGRHLTATGGDPTALAPEQLPGAATARYHLAGGLRRVTERLWRAELTVTAQGDALVGRLVLMYLDDPAAVLRRLLEAASGDRIRQTFARAGSTTGPA